jgi:predicted HTH transcriptional regulator
MEQKQKLADLILEKEHLHQDFKFEISDSRKIAKSLCAFANTSGGRLLIGVKDNGAIAGVRTDEEFYMVEAAAHLFSFPRIEFTTYTWAVNKKKVLQVNIEESDHKPHYVKNQDGSLEAFIRIHDQNIQAPEALVLLWQKQKHLKGSIIRYSENEQRLFKHLDKHETVSVSEFQELAEISEREASDTLANLILFELINYKYSGSEFRFYLKEC